MTKYIILTLYTVVTCLAENAPANLGAQEAILLIEEISNEVAQKKIQCYVWKSDNIKKIVNDETCRDLLKKELIAGIKSSSVDNILKYSWVEVEVLAQDVKQDDEHQKKILVKYRGEGGDTDITYGYIKINGELHLDILAISILEILRIRE